MRADAAPSSPARVLIAGVGLLGGAIGLALGSRHPSVYRTGLVRDRTRYEEALQAGIVDELVADPSAADSIDLAVVCTPVDHIVPQLQSIQTAHPNAVLTDVGSAKGRIVVGARALANAGRFVAAHPLAGSEQTGWQAATPQLLDDAVCVLTPTQRTDAAALATVEAFWRSLGMRTLTTSAGEHDRNLAMSSHLPHLAAAALVNAVVGPKAMRATGYRDCTRVAAGDAALWTAIVQQNADPILAALARLQGQLAHIQTAIGTEDWEAVSAWLAAAAVERRSLDEDRHATGDMA